MNKITRIVFTAVALCAVSGWTIWLVATMYAGSQSKINQQDYQDPASEIDQKAKAVNGADESAIRELADAVFHSPSLGTLETVSDVVARPYKERLIRSEMSYRKGLSEGVSEEKIVRLIDRLANEFGAPNYARTTQEEVHDLRLIISRGMPHFIPHQSTSEQSVRDSAGGLTIKSAMAPLEAIYVTRFLLECKLIFGACQLTPSERTNVKATLQKLKKAYQLTELESSFVMQDLIRQELGIDPAPRPADEIVGSARQRSAEAGEAGLKQTETVLSISEISSPRREAMEAARLRANEASLRDALRLVDELLDVLGMER